MPYDARQPTRPCLVCTSPANILKEALVGEDGVINCSRCGDFQIAHLAARELGLPFTAPKKQALASHTIRKMQAPGAPRPLLMSEFFHALESRTLPTPVEASDNLILWLAEKADGRPGARIDLTYSAPEVSSTIGVIGEDDVQWTVGSLTSQQLASGASSPFSWIGRLTAEGWKRFEELKRAHVASKFAFFARKFDNPDLDKLFDDCLRGAVEETGYELRTATQRAGLIDAVIEDEIRRCRFVVADLSDDNAGAYWEAGFAEGLGKDVIYICRADIGTHFDTDHRQTVRWNLEELDRTGAQLKAVIRNTLLGDANQSD